MFRSCYVINNRIPPQTDLNTRIILTAGLGMIKSGGSNSLPGNYLSLDFTSYWESKVTLSSFSLVSPAKGGHLS